MKRKKNILKGPEALLNEKDKLDDKNDNKFIIET